MDRFCAHVRPPYALEGFTCFHYAFISFPTLSYTLFYAFICFYVLFMHFHTHSNAKKQNVPASTATYTNVRLSRCAAGKKQNVPSSATYTNLRLVKRHIGTKYSKVHSSGIPLAIAKYKCYYVAIYYAT